MYTIVALGNPGEEYEHTRHNAGRLLLSQVLKEWGLGNSFSSSKFGGEVTEGEVAGQPVRVIFPDTYMNQSGGAVKKLAEETEADSLLIVHDEVALPLGTMKLSYGRGAGGHNGVSSIVAALDHRDFLRLRVGIAPTNWLGRMVRPSGDTLADFVLAPFKKREEEKLISLSTKAKEIIETVVKEGRQMAMNRFN